MIWTKENLSKLNSATKYPSIPTFHKIGENGILQDELEIELPKDIQLIGREKIDGTNSRVILIPDIVVGKINYFIGSREELLFYGKDLLYNPSESIVETINPIIATNKITSIQGNLSFDDVFINSNQQYRRARLSVLAYGKVPTDYIPEIVVLYFETYGGKIGGQNNILNKEN